MNDGVPDLEKLLAQAALIKVEQVSARFLKKIQEAWQRGKYGISFNSDEANHLKEISENLTYKTYKKIVGKNPYTPYIKLGILLYELSLKPEGKERFDEISKEVYRKKTEKIRRVIHIGSTGVIIHILEYLNNLSETRKISKERITEEFEKIMDAWEQYSIAVKNDFTLKQSLEMIKSKLLNNPNIVIVYGTGKASFTSQRSFAELNNSNILKNNNYFQWCKNREIFGTSSFLGILEKNTLEENPFS